MWALFVALLLALSLQPPMLVYLRRAQVLDHPTTRSSHVQSTLRGGGVAVAVAILFTLALAVASNAVEAALVLPAAIVVFCFATLGFAEDLRGVPAGRRFTCQLMGGALTASGAMLAGAEVLVALAIVVAVVVYSNAFNFMDGLNGISGLNAAFAGLVYAAIATRLDVSGVAVVGLAVAGAALGFLPFNFPFARVFLGDSGSYALGGVLALLAVQCWAGGAPLLLCAAPVSVYLADTGLTLLRRRLRGESLTVPHRDHTYQRLANSRLGHKGAVVLTVLSAALVTGMIYMAVQSPSGWVVGIPGAAIVLVAYIRAPGVSALTPSEAESGVVGVAPPAPPVPSAPAR